jgi:predicted nuclease with TOPRIM domain
VLSKLGLEEGPIREKYKLMKTDLTQIYKEMEEIISSVKYFEQVYQKHHNRIKKILVVSFIQFINYQKKMICNQGEGDYLRKTADLVETNLDDVNLLDITKIDLTEDLSYENQSRMETGFVFSEEYKALLNRFLFVAYTEWSQSQLFKATITKEIYIALNEDDNESFA